MDVPVPSGGLFMPHDELPGGKLAVPNPERERVRRFAGELAACRVDPDVVGSHTHPDMPGWVLVPRAAPEVLGIEPTATIEHPDAGCVEGRELPPAIKLAAKPRGYQRAVLAEAAKRPHGIVVMPPGAGKTVTALALAHELRLRLLVVVHTKDLMWQWIEASAKFLGQPLNKIGGSGKDTTGSDVGTVAMLQTLATWTRLEREALAATHGVLFVDESHHVPAEIAFKALWALGCPRRYGLTATPKRADGLQPLLHWALGPTLCEVTAADLVRHDVAVSPLARRLDSEFSSPLAKEVVARGETSSWRKFFSWEGYDLTDGMCGACAKGAQAVARGVPEREAVALAERLRGYGWKVESRIDAKSLAACYAAMCENTDRLALVAGAAEELLAEGRKVLILAGRVAHCDAIRDALADRDVECAVLTGKVATGKRKERLARFRSGEVMACVATTLADEGLDVPDMDGMVMAFPGRSEARTIQRVGRTMRAAPGKARPVVVDIVDAKMGVFVNQWQARRRAYRKANCEVEGG